MAEQTFGQQAVGLSFNPSELNSVDQIKSSYADLIDRANDTEVKSYLGNNIKGQAIRAAMDAQMWAVKLATFKE